MVLVSWRRHVDLDETINHLLARIAEMIDDRGVYPRWLQFSS